MSAVIVGSPSSGSKVLRRADFTTERNGLETLNEIYTVRTGDRRALQPSFGTLHSAYSTASTKFSRMAVENFSFRELDGDLTEINVTYVGLTSSSGLPAALIRLIPTPNAGIFGPDMVIEAEFLTDKSEAEFIDNGSGGLKNVSIIYIPESINGTKLPSNPRPPYRVDSFAGYYAYFGYTQQSLACEKRGTMLVAKTIFAENEARSISIAGAFQQGGNLV